MYFLIMHGCLGLGNKWFSIFRPRFSRPRPTSAFYSPVNRFFLLIIGNGDLNHRFRFRYVLGLGFQLSMSSFTSFFGSSFTTRLSLNFLVNFTSEAVSQLVQDEVKGGGVGSVFSIVIRLIMICRLFLVKVLTIKNLASVLKMVWFKKRRRMFLTLMMVRR